MDNGNIINTRLTTNISTNSTKATNRDVTVKPKPIKRHVDNPILSYQQTPLYAFNSPKNPTGLSPFQPTGKIY